MLALTAELADAWNVAWFPYPDGRFEDRMAGLDAALEAAGRDPRTLVRTEGLRVRDPRDGGGAPLPAGVFEGTAVELATVLDQRAALGIDHAIIRLEPKSSRALELVAEAAELHRRRG
jgi:alkanesulfonate monooxygenase SsuD/methylene tetrahydromethanopterin reductase-like flavin-dependent oxidoreductase (luciferase family)